LRRDQRCASFLRLPALRLKEKGAKSRLCDPAAVASCLRAMNFPDFLRIEREQRDGSRHYVVHTNDPKFSLELSPDGAAPDKIGQGVIKRVHVPNSWAGDYTKYSKFISAAQEFFRESFAEPASKAETKRFAR
jgi:hypothetical protein